MKFLLIFLVIYSILGFLWGIIAIYYQSRYAIESAKYSKVFLLNWILWPLTLIKSIENKKIMKMKNLIKNKNFWLNISVFFLILFTLLYKIVDIEIFLILALVSLIYPISIVVIGIIFVWIINPIRWLIKKIKNK